MELVLEFAIILAVCFAGEILYFLLPLPVPASIYGLVIMLILLLIGVVKERQIARVSSFILGIMTMCFIPSAVGLIGVWNDAMRMLAPLLLSAFIGLPLVMIVTGRAVQAVRRRKGGERDE